MEQNFSDFFFFWFCFWLLVSSFKLGKDHTLENQFWTDLVTKKGNHLKDGPKEMLGLTYNLNKSFGLILVLVTAC